MLALMLLVAAVFSIMLLSPDQWREIVAPFTGRTPSATIAVAPAPNAPSPPLAPTPSRPSTSSAIPPAPAPSAAAPAAGAINGELQSLRAALADAIGRLGDLERKGADTRMADLDNHLSRLDARIAALIEQPVVTPDALTDALNENRQAAQASAQEAAETAAQGAAQKAAQDAVQKALAAQNDMAPVVSEMEKRLTALEKMAPAVVGIGDMERRLSGLEKMAPAVAAIADIERRLASLEKTAASAATLVDLDKRIAAMEKATAPLTAMSQSALQGEALALGLLNLRLALDRGGAYADVLSALRIAAASDPVLTGEIDRLTPAAAVGAPTIAKLRQRLLAIPVLDDTKPNAAATPSAASETPAEPDGFWDGIWQRFASLVKVQRLDANTQTSGQSSSGPAHFGAAIERASARLEADDLAGAIGLLDDEVLRRPLSAGQQGALDDWLREARARLTAETGFATLSRRSLALFSAKADMPAAPSPRSDLAPSVPPVAPSAPPVVAPSAPPVVVAPSTPVIVPPAIPPQGAEVPSDDTPSNP